MSYLPTHLARTSTKLPTDKKYHIIYGWILSFRGFVFFSTFLNIHVFSPRKKTCHIFFPLEGCSRMDELLVEVCLE